MQEHLPVRLDLARLRLCGADSLDLLEQDERVEEPREHKAHVDATVDVDETHVHANHHDDGQRTQPVDVLTTLRRYRRLHLLQSVFHTVPTHSFPLLRNGAAKCGDDRYKNTPGQNPGRTIKTITYF